MKKLLYLIILTSLISCEAIDVFKPKRNKVQQISGEVLWAWNDLYIIAIANLPGYRPPISARAMGYIGLASYEAVCQGTDEYQSVASNFSGLEIQKKEVNQTYHWGVVLNNAYYKIYRGMFRRSLSIDDARKSDSVRSYYNNLFAAEIEKDIFEKSKEYGTGIGESVFQYSFSDGQELAFQNNKPTGYRPPIGQGLWRATLPDTLRALTPFWGGVRPFALQFEDRAMLEPLKFSTEKTSQFYGQANEVYLAVKNTTKEDLWIAEYWSDDASTFTIDAAARWLSIANQALKKKNSNLETSAIVTAKIGMALHDASVACWGNKYKYNLIRPASFINDHIDSKWQTLLRDPTKKAGQQTGITPQHPSYPSGHSVFGQAAAEVLIAELGDKINLTDRSGQGRPYAKYYDMRPRTFKTFTDMANENAFSRIKLGVHYRMDCEQGLVLGKKVGQRINSLNWKKPAL